MPVTVTSNYVLNAALNLIGGNQSAISGLWPNFDITTAVGVAANSIYQECVQAVAREFGWDFARNVAALQLTGNAPPGGWSFEYAYPTSGIEVRELIPAVISDPNDPLPNDYTIGNNTVGGTPTKVIWANLANAQCSFTGQPPESLWDPLFVETVIRRLASGLAGANEGKPETQQAMLESSFTFSQIGQGRPD
jgi:hypothetical protein